jgi:hypothetical protein
LFILAVVLKKLRNGRLKMKKAYRILGFYVWNVTSFKLQNTRSYPPSVSLHGTIIVESKSKKLTGSIDNALGIAEIKGKVNDDGTLEMKAIYGKTWSIAELGPVLISLKKDTNDLAGGWRGTWRLEDQTKGENYERECVILCAMFPL